MKSVTTYGILICDYSKTRASKGKSDREKQIGKVELNLKTPGKFSARGNCIKIYTQRRFNRVRQIK